MNFVPWRKFVPLVRLSTAQCPVSGIVAQLRHAAREFCSYTRVWTSGSLKADILAGEPAYGLRPADQTDIVTVLEVRFNGTRLTPLTPDKWRALPEQRDSQPQGFIYVDPGVVRLWPTPSQDVAAALAVEVVLQPAVDSQQAPDFLFTKYGTVIGLGAQSRLMLMPDRPWTDVGGGAVFSKQFDDGVAGARINVEQGGSGAPSVAEWIPYD